MKINVSSKNALGVLPLLVGYSNSVKIKPSNIHLKHDEGIAMAGNEASTPSTHIPRRMLKKKREYSSKWETGNSTMQDVDAQIIGGTDVPLGKYKVRYQVDFENLPALIVHNLHR